MTKENPHITLSAKAGYATVYKVSNMLQKCKKYAKMSSKILSDNFSHSFTLSIFKIFFQNFNNEYLLIKK